MLSGAEVKVNTATFKNDTVNIQNRDEVLLVGINYDKKSKEHQCLIEKYEKD